MPRITIRLLAAALALAATACGSARPGPSPVTELVADARYVIGAGDTLAIRVWKNPDLAVDAPVRPDGNISVPLLDDVQAAGLTTLELKELITRELGEFIEAPDVTVLVNAMGSQRAFVIGEVRQPGQVALVTRMRVLDAIAAVGGFGPFANKKGVKVIRFDDQGGEVEYPFNYDSYVSGRAPGANIVLQPGDTIVVPD